MLKRTRSFLVLSLAFATIAPMLLSAPSVAQAQNRHAYLEEFTGSWCGYCVRGAYALQKLDENFPGKVAIVSIHVAQGPTEPDAMNNAQGDSIVAGIGFPQPDKAGFPDGWTARTVEGSSWDVDPSAWADSVGVDFGVTSLYTPGLVDAIIAQPAIVQCKVDNVTFNSTTDMVTARVTATFASVMSGDFRLNLMVTEDSVSGAAGSGYDQHNYYSSTVSVGAANPNNPRYHDPAVIVGWEHMHVFREAVGGIYGTSGIIPGTTSASGIYTKTFSFPLPATVLNPNHVHLVGLVNQYSATSETDNQVFDAMDVPLSTTPISYAPNDILVTSDNGSYLWAHAGGDTTAPLTVENDGTGTMAITLSVDATALPAGWAVTFSPSPVTVASGGSQPVTMTITAPTQSGFIQPAITIRPQEDGVFIPISSAYFGALSDNTEYPIIYDAPDGASGAEIATVNGLPDSMRSHAAVIPLSPDMLLAYPPENFPVSIYDNIPILDNGGYYSNPTILPDIQASLAAGGKVFFSSDEAMFFAEDPNAASAAYTGTQAVQDFYSTLGLNFTATEDRFNTQTGAPIAYLLKGTTDPIGNGISVNNAGGYPVFNEVYSIDSNSVALFYADNKTKNIIGSRYEDPVTHGRIVYLGFDFNGITLQSKADTIYNRSINWLLSAPSAAVNAPAATAAASISASPNPFHGLTQVQYVAGANEHGVSLSAYDVLGREVAKLATQSNGGSVYTASFDGSKLADGTYVIVAHSTTGTHEVRVVNQQ